MGQDGDKWDMRHWVIILNRMKFDLVESFYNGNSNAGEYETEIKITLCCYAYSKKMLYSRIHLSGI